MAAHSRAARLSVIIPTLNEAAAIGALLDDLAPVRSRGHQVILSDGGSHDPTLAIAGRRVDRIVQGAAGRAIQMNAAAQVAEGDILWFLHADSRIPTGAAEALLTAVAAGAKWGRFDIRLAGHHPLLRVIATLMNLRSRLTGVATGDQGIFVTREAFTSAGGFPAIPLMEDVALSKRLRRLARPACIRSTVLQTSARRWERHGVIRTVLLMWSLRLGYALGVSPARLARHYR